MQFKKNAKFYADAIIWLNSCKILFRKNLGACLWNLVWHFHHWGLISDFLKAGDSGIEKVKNNSDLISKEPVL